MPEPRTAVEAEGSEAGGEPGPQPGGASEQLVEAREEILRLRDLLVGQEAELGRLRGEVAELQERLGRYTWLADRLRVRRLASAAGRRINRLRNR